MTATSRKRPPQLPVVQLSTQPSASPTAGEYVFAADVRLEADLREARAANERLAHRNAALFEEVQAMQAALQQAQDKACRASRLQALGQVASGVAHDFNNALTTILGISDWLVHELPPETPHRTDIETIRTAAQDAAAMVRRLQMFGRLSPNAGRQEPQEIVDLADVARVVADLVRPRCQELAVRSGRHYDVVVDGTTGPTVLASAGEIRELLINLVFNALDAMTDGGIVRIVTRLRAGHAEVAVIDSGIGMADDVKARIFEPFFSTKGQKGNGLGLSVCASIAERHGAALSVDSTPGAGSTFVLSFAPQAASAETDSAQEQPTCDAAPRPLQVLVVDDEPDVCDSLGAMVTALGHVVSKASNGQTALTETDTHAFDIVVTDLGMPGMNGLELASRITARRPATVVVLVTAWGVDFGARLPDAISTVVAKPATMRTLQQALIGAVSRASAGPARSRSRLALGPFPTDARRAPILDGMEAS